MGQELTTTHGTPARSARVRRDRDCVPGRSLLLPETFVVAVDDDYGRQSWAGRPRCGPSTDHHRGTSPGLGPAVGHHGHVAACPLQPAGQHPAPAGGRHDHQSRSSLGQLGYQRRGICSRWKSNDDRTVDREAIQQTGGGGRRGRAEGWRR